MLWGEGVRIKVMRTRVYQKLAVEDKLSRRQMISIEWATSPPSFNRRQIISIEWATSPPSFNWSSPLLLLLHLLFLLLLSLGCLLGQHSIVCNTVSCQENIVCLSLSPRRQHSISVKLHCLLGPTRQFNSDMLDASANCWHSNIRRGFLVIKCEVRLRRQICMTAEQSLYLWMQLLLHPPFPRLLVAQIALFTLQECNQSVAGYHLRRKIENSFSDKSRFILFVIVSLILSVSLDWATNWCWSRIRFGVWSGWIIQLG